VKINATLYMRTFLEREARNSDGRNYSWINDGACWTMRPVIIAH